MNKLTELLYNSMNQNQQAKFLGARAVDGDIPLNLGAALGENGAGLKDLGSAAVGATISHPFKAMGLIGSGMGNLGGLTDNNKIGGQIAGLGLGGLAASTLATGNPYMAAMLTMGGGNLGALFDKLRARKEQEQAQGYPNAGNPVAMLGR